MYDAIILAGGENSKRLNTCTTECYEALIEIAGKPMVTFVAEALAASNRVENIYILGPAEELARYQFPANTHLLEGGGTIAETIEIGIAALGHSRRVLVATADIPLLTVEAIDDFLNQCGKVEADLYYPIVSQEVNERRFPGNKRTYVRLKEGTFTGGNIFLVNPLIVNKCMKVANKFIENRKNPLKLCQILGLKFVMKFLLGALNLREVERRVSELLGITGAVIMSRYPELGIDVDKPSDLELVRATFSRV